MSQAYISQGKFEEIGDTYTIQLDPITAVASFDNFQEDIFGAYVDKFLVPEFRYSVNSGSFSSWASLTPSNLSAIVVAAPTDDYSFEIRYTRSGANPDGVVQLISFELLCSQVLGFLEFRINKTEYDTVYGTYKYLEIVDKIATFNSINQTLYGVSLVVADEPSLSNQQVEIVKTAIFVTDFDVNELWRAGFGKALIDDMFEIDIDLYDGIRT